MIGRVDPVRERTSFLRIVLGIFILTWFLFACGIPEESPPANVISQGEGEDDAPVVDPTATVSVTTSPSSTSTSIPSETVPPSTPTPVPTSTATLPPRRSAELERITRDNLSSLQPLAAYSLERSDWFEADLQFAPNNQWMGVTTTAGELRVWDLDKGTTFFEQTLIDEFQGEENLRVGSRLAFSHNSAYIAAVGRALFVDGDFQESYGAVMLWHMPSGSPPKVFYNETHRASNGVSFSPNREDIATGTSLGMGGGGYVQRWKLGSGEKIGAIGFPDWISDVAYAPDGSKLAASSYDEIHILDSETAFFQRSITTPGGPLWDIEFLKDSRTIVFPFGSTVYFMDSFENQIVKSFTGFEIVGDFALSPREDLLATSASETYQVDIWDVETGEVIHTFGEGQGKVSALAFAPDGKSLATLHTDGAVILWGVP